MVILLAAIGALCAFAFAPGLVAADPGAIRAIVTAGQPAPGGGSFEHFSVESLPIVAPLNGKGQVVFFATILRGPGSEGLFLASPRGIVKVAAEGDRTPGGGAISGFGRQPIPSLNEAGTVVFAAAVVSGRTVEGIFTAARGRLQAVAVAGAAAPGVPSGTLAGVDSPVINDRGDVAFLASVRRGRETADAIYLRSGGKLRKIVAQGDPAPAGGAFAGFGPPSLDSNGAVVFVAVVEGRAVPGGIFRARAGQLEMVVGAGDDTPVGGIFMKFSERVAINDAGLVAFHAVVKDAATPAGIFAVHGKQVRRIAAVGNGAAGGGTFSHFGPWPAVNAAGDIAFTGSVDAGPSPVAVFVARRSGTARVVGIGDTLPGGGKVATLTLYPVIALGPTGALTFATAPTATGEGAEGIYTVAPSP